ncbi:MAG: MBL fold metallo-hydrolase [Planctomycetales bacterium]|nr:MBL fold metallo-hydrolase [Planctomycetales bacterium]
MLGTGTSVGVPMVGCGCHVCRSIDRRNHRTRCAIILGLPGGNLLIDTPPDLHWQLVREQIGIVNAVVYTHEHADHIFGLDDLRLMPFYLGHAVPLYCEELVEARIRKSYDYAFTNIKHTHAGAVPALTFHRIDGATPFDVLETRLTPIPLQHGPRFNVLGFRIHNVAYCTDVNHIPTNSWGLLEGLDVLILGALRREPHPTHFCLEEAVAVAKKVGAKRTIFTHISHDLEYTQTNAELPDAMELGYDGLRIDL